MPGGDGTGPAGMGPRTGRAAGYCAGYNAPGYANQGPGMGMAWGRGRGRGLWGRGLGLGRGRGWGRGYYPHPGPYYAPSVGGTYPEPTREDEKVYLERVLGDLENEMKEIGERIKELSKEAEK